ncbi:hypothetical protein LMG28690_03153 [Paraburkholderia caffeinilytica]|nr:hypothetical protein LMG28690_03153 [Paraburkholderia caffeinilytica]
MPLQRITLLRESPAAKYPITFRKTAHNMDRKSQR